MVASKTNVFMMDAAMNCIFKIGESIGPNQNELVSCAQIGNTVVDLNTMVETKIMVV